jgi:Lrp/AsnC family transcriptional regulator, leucine-responsive regulatory protein
MNIDKKDHRILYELDTDSRQTNAEIARKVGLSKQAVGLRLKRLGKAGLMTAMYAVIDISRLGLSAHKNFVRLQNMTLEQEQAMVSALKEHPDVVWLASFDGRFDLCFSVWASDMDDLDKTLRDVERRFGAHFAERQIASIVKGEYFLREYLLGRAESKERRSSFFGAVPTPASLDALDWRILVALGKNARQSARELAKHVGSHPNTVAVRLRKLEKSGVVRHYNIVPNEAVWPWLHYKVLLSYRNATEARERALIEYCRQNTNVVYVVKAVGPWEFELDIEIEDAASFRELLRKLKARFGDIISDYSVLHVYQVHKYNFCPSERTKAFDNKHFKGSV